MIASLRQQRTPAQRARLLHFTPVPRERNRADGWTPDRQHAFLEALADCGCVSRAARMVGMAPEGVYALRRHPHGRSFMEAWDRAQDVGVQRLRDIAFERAIEGVPVPVFYKGEQVGERRWYSDRLLMCVLRYNDPDRYGTGSAAHRISPATIAKLRAEWERENAIKTAQDARGVRARMDRKLDEIYKNIRAREAVRWEEEVREEHDSRLAERAALGLFGPVDPLNQRPPFLPQIPSPHAKPGHEWPRGWSPEGKHLPPPLPNGPTIRTF